mgnify:CR=1 FL=1
MNRTLTVLTAAASVAQTGAPIVVLLGGIVGATMAPVPGLATLPVALMIVGTAMSTIPASLLMRRVGRKVGFIFAAATIWNVDLRFLQSFAWLIGAFVSYITYCLLASD